ncbi:MAG: serine/threonine protein kinase [Planctomycetota bacterium]|jgi:serine/threonine-protein kinase
MAESEYDNIINAALKAGVVDEEQLEECRRIQDMLEQSGIHKSLGDVMQDKGYLTSEQIRELTEALSKADKQPIRGYRISDTLGKGGMGVVYKALQISLDKTVALKVLPPELAADQDYVARFIREAKSAAKLNHPNIVQAIDVGESGGYNYFVMEYVDGVTVRKRLKDEGMFTEDEALDVVQQVARALEHAQENSIVHRDIKPDNIMLTKKGRAKLCDLGLAKSTKQEAHLTQTGTALGTPYYISPEQARGDDTIDTRSDIYSLGITLFHMVTGQVPFNGPTPMVIMTKHLTDRMPDPRSVRTTLSPEICAVINKMTMKDPELRHQTAATLAEAIEAIRLKRRALQSELQTGSQTASAATLKVEAVAAPSSAPTLERETVTAPSARAVSQAPKKSSAGLIAFVIILVLVIGGAAGAYFGYFKDKWSEASLTGPGAATSSATSAATVTPTIVPRTSSSSASVTPRTATAKTGGIFRATITGSSRTGTAAAKPKTGTSTGTKESQSSRAYAALESFATTNPDSFDRILEDAENIVKKYAGTTGAKKAAELAENVRKRRGNVEREKAAEEAFRKLEPRVRMLTAEKKFEEAKKLLGDFRRKHSGTLSAGRAISEAKAVDAARVAWEKEQAVTAAEARGKQYAPIDAEAQKLAAAGEFSKALAMLDGFISKYGGTETGKKAAAQKDNIAKLRDEFFEYYKSKVDEVSGILGEGKYEEALVQLKELQKAPEVPEEQRERVKKLFASVRERMEKQLREKYSGMLETAQRDYDGHKYKEAKAALEQMVSAEDIPEEIRKEAIRLLGLVESGIKEEAQKESREKRQKEAERLYRELVNLIEENQWQSAMDTAHRLIREYSDTELVKAKKAEILSDRKLATKRALKLLTALRCEVDLVEKPRRVKCFYDFRRAGQKLDWKLMTPPDAKNEPDVWTVSGQKLVGGGRKGYQWKAEVRGDITISFKLKAKKGGLTVQLYTTTESGYEFNLETNAEFEISSLGRGGQRKRLAISRGLDFRPGKQAEITITLAGNRISIHKDGEEVISATDACFRSGPLTFWALDSQVEIDDLEITATLNDNWPPSGGR